MAISTIPVGRCYRQALDILRRGCTGASVLKEDLERGKGAKVGHRIRGIAHGRTSDSVEHPERNLQHATAWLTRSAASSHLAVRLLHNAVNANRLASPRMPGIRNGPLVEGLSNVGVLSFSCTIPSDAIRHSIMSVRFSSKGWPNSYQTALHLSEANPGRRYFLPVDERRAGCTWPWSSISSLGGWSAGRSVTASTRNWHSRR